MENLGGYKTPLEKREKLQWGIPEETYKSWMLASHKAKLGKL